MPTARRRDRTHIDGLYQDTAAAAESASVGHQPGGGSIRGIARYGRHVWETYGAILNMIVGVLLRFSFLFSPLSPFFRPNIEITYMPKES